jgi:chemotaxis receptor (MCP) glutamine deamidase CheD
MTLAGGGTVFASEDLKSGKKNLSTLKERV